MFRVTKRNRIHCVRRIFFQSLLVDIVASLSAQERVVRLSTEIGLPSPLRLLWFRSSNSGRTSACIDVTIEVNVGRQDGSDAQQFLIKRCNDGTSEGISSNEGRRLEQQKSLEISSLSSVTLMLLLLVVVVPSAEPPFPNHETFIFLFVLLRRPYGRCNVTSSHNSIE